MKLKRRKKLSLADRVEKVRGKARIFESEGVIYAYLPFEPSIRNIKQCIVLLGKDSFYDGVYVDEIPKFEMDWEDLDEADTLFLLGELE